MRKDAGKSISQRRVRLEFEHRGVEFHVYEPYGDNSRYWILPKERLVLCDPLQLNEIEEAFRKYRPPTLVKIFGDIVSLNFKGLLSGS